jgi:hypothetical protein
MPFPPPPPPPLPERGGGNPFLKALPIYIKYDVDVSDSWFIVYFMKSIQLNNIQREIQREMRRVQVGRIEKTQTKLLDSSC